MYSTLLFFFLSLLAPFSSFADMKVKIVGIVNGELISDLDVEKDIKVVKHFSKSDLEYKDIYNFSLDNLIRNSLIQQEAKDLNISFSTEDINAYIESFMSNKVKNEVGLKKYAEDNNLDYHSILRTIKSKMIFDKIIGKKVLSTIKVTKDEIQDFQEQIKNRIASDYIVNLVKISYPKSNNTELDNSILKAIKKSSDIEVLKGKYKNISITELKMNSTNMLVEIKNLVNTKKVGEVIGPLAINDNKILLKILDKVSLTEIPNNSTVHIKKLSVKSEDTILDFFKKGNFTCTQVDELVNKQDLYKPSEVKVNALELDTNIQYILQKLREKGKYSQIISENNGFSNIIVFCNVIENIDSISRKLYDTKLSIKANSLLDSMYKRSFIKKI